jgi:glycerophosphoryl diester phosphodiesterase
VLFLDLKGRDVRLSSLVIEVFDRDAPTRRYAVCSQTWHLLAPFEGRPAVTVAYSVGSRRQLRRVIPLLEQIGPHAVSIHARLLDPATMRALKAVASLVIPWAVKDEVQMRQLLDWGVDGISSENLDLLRILRAGLLEPPAGLGGEKNIVTGAPPHQVDG